MEEPTAPEDSSEDFYGGVMTLPKRLSILEHPLKEKRLCVRWWMITFKNTLTNKEFRREDSNRRRQGMASKFADKVMEESVKLLKRKRTETPPNKSPSDKRAAKRAAKRAEDEPSITRQLFQESDEEESSDDEEIKEEKRLRKLNAGIKKYIPTISTATKVHLQIICTKVSDIDLEKLSSSEKANTILKTRLLNQESTT
ncbi:unnamed protein product [Phytophthora lilii]|uniref:Unnamed protein product n=1 Tax=Phytophthora lilii TaxID=2077276 RepID=A0A9W6X9I9_9STRA|nr:unnamed protein product [Phytophthora lilii]